ncbi:MAG TPA: hypothetical protein VMN39_03225 [Longimicrobiaceae bacterium]|nr:hypothetical protein [Longimicrobiaceae bacterium]
MRYDMKPLENIVRTALVLVLAVTTLAACDSPTEPDDHAAGVVFLRADGSEAARFVFAPRALTGGLSVAVGQSVTYRLRVLTEGGAIVPVDGAEYSIRDPRIVITLAASIAIENNDQLVITGGATPRNTSVLFDLWHASHIEFQVSGVPLAVQ